MTLTTEWANPEKTILLQTIDGEWTINDVVMVIEQGKQKVAEVPHTVDIIVNLTNARFSRPNLLSALGNAQRSRGSNIGKIMVVQASSYLKSITNIASKVAPKVTSNIGFVETVEEAYAMLKQSQKA